MKTTRPRRVLVTTGDSSDYGGMEVHIELLLMHLDRGRYEPSFFVPSNPHMSITPQMLGNIEKLDVPLVHAPKTLGLRVGSQIDNITGFAKALRRVDADLLHMHHWRPGGDRYPVLGARLARTPAIVRTEHLPPKSDYISDEFRKICRRYDRQCDVVIHVSEGNRQQHVTLLDRDPNKLQVLHNGIEIRPVPEEQARLQAKLRYGFDPAVPLIGVIGRLDEQKGHDILLDAIPQIVAEVGRINVAIVGEGDLRDELGRQASALDIDEYVQFTGFLSDPSEILSAFDIAVMPSRYEGFALSMLEMMAASKPCVFSDHASFIEGTAGGSVARLVPIGDVRALAAAVVELIRSPEAAAVLGQRARQHVIANFSIERHIESLMDVYDRVLGVGE